MTDFNNFIEEEEELRKLCTLEDGHILLNHFYNIDLDRCDTHEKILAWIYHLGEKTWVTPDMLRRFIAIACDANNLEINHNV